MYDVHFLSFQLWFLFSCGQETGKHQLLWLSEGLLPWLDQFLSTPVASGNSGGQEHTGSDHRSVYRRGRNSCDKGTNSKCIRLLNDEISCMYLFTANADIWCLFAFCPLTDHYIYLCIVSRFSHLQKPFPKNVIVYELFYYHLLSSAFIVAQKIFDCGFV